LIVYYSVALLSQEIFHAEQRLIQLIGFWRRKTTVFGFAILCFGGDVGDLGEELFDIDGLT
jgi:hypothetical protein